MRPILCGRFAFFCSTLLCFCQPLFFFRLALRFFAKNLVNVINGFLPCFGDRVFLAFFRLLLCKSLTLRHSAGGRTTRQFRSADVVFYIAKHLLRRQLAFVYAVCRATILDGASVFADHNNVIAVVYDSKIAWFRDIVSGILQLAFVLRNFNEIVYVDQVLIICANHSKADRPGAVRAVFCPVRDVPLQVSHAVYRICRLVVHRDVYRVRELIIGHLVGNPGFNSKLPNRLVGRWFGRIFPLLLGPCSFNPTKAATAHAAKDKTASRANRSLI